MSRSLIVLAALATLQAAAFTDFHAMNPHHKQTEMADGMIHSSHDVHHVFEGGSSFKAKYDAIHHKKWHFIKLDDHDVDFVKHVDCGAGDHELHVEHPSKTLKDAVSQQNYEWTVLTANHRFHCSGTGIFRAVTGSSFDSELDRLTLQTVQMKYEDVFEHLDFHMETDHFDGEVVHVEGEQDLSGSLPTEDNHAMTQQGWLKRTFKKAKKAVSKVVSKAKKTVKKVVSKVTNAVKTIKQVLSKDYSVTKTWKLKTLSYNKDVSKSFSVWNFNGAVKLAASASATPSLVFNLKISTLKLQLVETYFRAYYKAGVRVSFNSAVQYDNEASKTISLINLNSVTFSVVNIPVVISVTCPITAGYDIDVDGRVNFNFLLSAYGNVKFGVRYTKSRGFQAINEKSLRTVRDFSPRYYRYEVGLQAQVMANFKASMNFLGWAQASLEVSAEGLLQKNNKCTVLLQLTMQPVVAAGAYLNIKVGSIQLLKKTWGPIVPYSTKVPVINYCLPVARSTRSSILSRWRSNERAMLVQETGEEAAQDPSNEQPVEITRPTDIEENSTGTVWYGYRDCTKHGMTSTTYSKQEVSFSMQFLPGNFTDDEGNVSTQIVLTLTHNNTVMNSDDYSQTNLQQTYLMNATIQAGFEGALERYADEEEESQYSASVNEELDQVKMDNTMTLKVDSEDVTKMWVSAPTMFCGAERIELVSQEYSDDNSTFQVFASGESNPDKSFFQKVKDVAVIVVPIVLVIVAAVVIVVLVVFRRKRVNATRQGANWAKSQDIEPIMQATHNDAADTNMNSNVQQDSRLDAL